MLGKYASNYVHHRSDMDLNSKKQSNSSQKFKDPYFDRTHEEKMQEFSSYLETKFIVQDNLISKPGMSENERYANHNDRKRRTEVS